MNTVVGEERHNYQELSCGCRMWNEIHDGKKVFILKACSKDCAVVRIAQEESKRHEIPYIEIDRDKGKVTVHE